MSFRISDDLSAYVVVTRVKLLGLQVTHICSNLSMKSKYEVMIYLIIRRGICVEVAQAQKDLWATLEDMVPVAVEAFGCSGRREVLDIS